MAQQTYMLVMKGVVQRMEVTDPQGQPIKVWPVTQNHADAVRLRDWLNTPGTAVAEIGSAEGETLEQHVAMAIQEGCGAVVCIAGWDHDGSPKWRSLPM